MAVDPAREAAAAPTAAPRTAAVLVFVAALAAAAAGVVLSAGDLPPRGEAAWPALPVLVGMVALAEYLVVRYRWRGHLVALTLVEAAMAPLLWAFPLAVAVGGVVLAQLVAGVLHRVAPVKTAFNLAQWALAAACGGATLTALAGPDGPGPRTALALAAALVVMALVNDAAFSVVLALADRRPPRALLQELAPVLLPGWGVGLALNTVLGLLYVLAYAGHPMAVLLFAVPVVGLHLADRGWAGARAERSRLATLHRAAAALAVPLDPRDALPDFLDAVTRGLRARESALVLAGGPEVFRSTDGVAAEPALVALAGRGLCRDTGEAAHAAGARTALVAPLPGAGGALVVLDPGGLDDAADGGELPVLEALARQTADALAKSGLLDRLLLERRRYAEIVGATSDGICTLAPDGTLLSWNPALERLTGHPAAEAVGSRDVVARLQPRTAAGEPVDLGGWAGGGDLPEELVVTASDGTERPLACSYSEAVGDDGARTLVVVARDVTAQVEAAAQRARAEQLAAEQAAARTVVEHLQSAVMPPRPDVTGVDLGVAYLPSDPSAPTGGDLYDWQPLPDGRLHVAVVDVLGHGVAATKHALAVVHALRLAAVDGTPLSRLVERADALLGALDPDLVATVVVAHYDPATGQAQVVCGGHPPALHVPAHGEVVQLAAAGGAIGWPGAGSDTVADVLLAPGDALVLYTDGLVESRKDILEGMEALVAHAAAVAQLPAGELADGLVERSLAGAQRRDDSLALVLRRLPVPVPRAEVRWRVPADTAQVPVVRKALQHWLGDDPVHDDVALVASELLANAVSAARSEVVLEARADDAVVELLVTDDGAGAPRGLADVGRVLPSSWAERGRGLFIVRTLVDDLRVVTGPEGTVVTCSVPRVAPAGHPVPPGSPVAGDAAPERRDP